MKITILTLFPTMFQGPLSESIVKNAIRKNLVTIDIVDIRNFGIGNHKVVDNPPYGGGVGMVLRVDVVEKAIQSVKKPELTKDEQKVFIMEADGDIFTQKKAEELSQLKHLILVCGHYEGFDERIKKYIDGELSIGPFVLTGGEIPAMAITDAITRLIPGVLKEDATVYESFSKGIGPDTKEYPHYTRPSEYNGEKVPDILLSGDHKKIEAWRKEKSSKVK